MVREFFVDGYLDAGRDRMVACLDPSPQTLLIILIDNFSCKLTTES